jgi:hypothetical protein
MQLHVENQQLEEQHISQVQEQSRSNKDAVMEMQAACATAIEEMNLALEVKNTEIEEMHAQVENKNVQLLAVLAEAKVLQEREQQREGAEEKTCQQ